MKNLLVLAVSSFLSMNAFAAQLDLGTLASYDYTGQDALHGNASCRLVVSAIRQDFSGRMVQDFRLWTDSRNDLNFTLSLKGPNRYRDGNSQGAGHSQYHVTFDANELALLSDDANPAIISEWNLFDSAGLTGAGTNLIKCQNVRATPR